MEEFLLALRLPKETEKRLENLAKQELEEIQRGAPTFSLSEVEKELGLDS